MWTPAAVWAARRLCISLNVACGLWAQTPGPGMPHLITAKRWAENPDPSMIWEGHKAGREIPYWQMEKLNNLDALPANGFTVACFPVKIKAASAGWTRCVAILD